MNPRHPTDRDRRRHRRPRRTWSLPLAAVAGLLLAAPAAAEPHGYTVSYDNLLRLDLSNGEAEIVGPTGSDHSLRALTRGPAEALYGLGATFGERALLRLDPATGAGEVIAAIPDGVNVGALAATGDGDLWLAVDADLYRVDPATGALAPPVLLQEPVRALASRGRELYGFTLDDQLQRIDAASGALELVLDLELPFESVLDAHFDARGALWFLTQRGGGPLITVYLAVYRIADLDAGAVEQTFGREFAVSDSRFEMKSLALPPPATVDVPTLGGAALGLLALLITGAALAILRRRRGPQPDC